MGKVNVVIVDATGNKEQKVGLPDDIKCGIIMVKLIEKIKLPSVGPDGNPISYKFIHKVTGRQLLEAQTLGEAGIKDGDVLRLQPEITAGASCGKCGMSLNDKEKVCPNCGFGEDQESESASKPAQPSMANPVQPAQPPMANPAQFAQPPMAGHAPWGNITNNKPSIKKLPLFGGIVSGFLSVIFGIIMIFLDTGYFEGNETYGGDAYTGIQNAAAQTANNILQLNGIAKLGFAFLLISLGLVAICYFGTKLFKKEEK